MKSNRCLKISKYLSYHLRHHPEELGLELAPGGWVEVEKLLAACLEAQFPLTREELEEVVTNNDKQRFSFDQTKTLIRANQGHSVPVDLQLTSLAPPEILYHGTSTKAVPSILSQGLLKMARHHVHLSTTIEAARKVGQRQGKPVVFELDAAAMYQAGYQFFVSENGVWLVETVPPAYLRQIYPLLVTI
ncbi:RNA 2'-phosphotransferase [Gloeothece verrucosa]|uniref:Probable RNA 2'-phosphotransferase n=1 Tax=Gloeothece verrucosa (strain PCC 7822) TaxID=497965 RepID=E0U558_GLOV7|nr:RNA 2'-phosphotransferase [Gloeothece verrucosa]ADN12337.1 phosphotransferase KptA/Tpt1 [Gloeothece verrucosa PCC 7822]